MEKVLIVGDRHVAKIERDDSYRLEHAKFMGYAELKVTDLIGKAGEIKETIGKENTTHLVVEVGGDDVCPRDDSDDLEELANPIETATALYSFLKDIIDTTGVEKFSVLSAIVRDNTEVAAKQISTLNSAYSKKFTKNYWGLGQAVNLKSFGDGSACDRIHLDPRGYVNVVRHIAKKLGRLCIFRKVPRLISTSNRGVSECTRYDHFLFTHEADSLARVLSFQDYHRIGNRDVCYFGIHDYGYGNVVHKANPSWPSFLVDLRRKVEKFTGWQFNSALINRYQSGADHMPLHADNEITLGKDPFIASLSVGQEREFFVVPNTRRSDIVVVPEFKKEMKSIPLRHGSLLTMGGAMQHDWKHSIKPDLECTGERFNVTFRWQGTFPS